MAGKARREQRAANAAAVERVLAWLEAYIRRRRLDVGDSLPTEMEIARAMGSARSSVREALTALKALGIICTRRRGGIRIIRDPFLLEIRHYFAERYHDRGRYEDALEFRAALEWGLGPLFFDRIAQRTIRLLKAIVKEVAAADPAKADIAAAELRFHAAMLKGCGNRLAALLGHIYVPIFAPDALSGYGGKPAEIEKWIGDHAEMVEALACRRKEHFFAALRRHTQCYMRWQGRAREDED